MTHFHGLWVRLIEVVVLVRELLDHVQLVSFDIALEHFRRGVAGDFHDVEDVHAGQVHERGSGTTSGVRHHELVFLDGFLPAVRPSKACIPRARLRKILGRGRIPGLWPRSGAGLC